MQPGPDQAPNGRQSATAVMHPAVVKLAEGTALIAHIVADRPRLAISALLDGVPPQSVADAVGLDMIEFRPAIGRWASARLRDGELDRAAWTWLTNTIFGPAS